MALMQGEWRESILQGAGGGRVTGCDGQRSAAVSVAGGASRECSSCSPLMDGGRGGGTVTRRGGLPIRGSVARTAPEASDVVT